MKEIKTIAENYRMGILSPMELVQGYHTILAAMGAQKVLEDFYNEILADLADHLCGIAEGSEEQIQYIITRD